MAKEKKLVQSITSRDEDFAQWYTDVAVSYTHLKSVGTYEFDEEGNVLVNRDQYQQIAFDAKDVSCLLYTSKQCLCRSVL